MTKQNSYDITALPKLFEPTSPARQYTRVLQMAQALKDSFLDLERHRQLLEENIEKLRKSLQHWQTWEAEYEGLKEEIEKSPYGSTHAELVAIGRDYEAELVTTAEVEDIMGVKSGNARTADQMTNLLSRRIDYVAQNVQAVAKQLEAAENKLAVATIISTPDVRNEDGLPLTEIMEELDEEGNVISSHTTTPGSAKPQLMEALRKAGLSDIPSGEAEVSTAAIPEPVPENIPAAPVSATKSKKPTPKPVKRGVSFTEDTKSGPELEKSQTAKRLEEIMSIAKEQERPPTEPAIIPVDESAEDAAFRHQMLQYGMSEIGAVVAELNLEEEGVSYSDEDWGDDLSSVDDDDEDQFGRSTAKVVDDEMRQRMRDLEERLGVRMMENVGPQGAPTEEQEDADYEIVREGIGQISIKPEESVSSAQPSPPLRSGLKKAASSERKGVRFAEELDIAQEPQPKSQSQPTATVRDNLTGKPPVADIVERSAPKSVSPETAEPRRVSKFKSARATTAAISSDNSSDPLTSSIMERPTPSTPIATAPIHHFSGTERVRTVPSGPPGRTLADAVPEREVQPDSVPEPDDLDPALLQQEVVSEYHKMRNRMIQRQGGFAKPEERAEVPLSEAEGGRRVSRFMAVRLGK